MAAARVDGESFKFVENLHVVLGVLHAQHLAAVNVRGAYMVVPRRASLSGAMDIGVAVLHSACVFRVEPDGPDGIREARDSLSVVRTRSPSVPKELPAPVLTRDPSQRYRELPVKRVRTGYLLYVYIRS